MRRADFASPAATVASGALFLSLQRSATFAAEARANIRGESVHGPSRAMAGETGLPQRGTTFGTVVRARQTNVADRKRRHLDRFKIEPAASTSGTVTVFHNHIGASICQRQQTTQPILVQAEGPVCFPGRRAVRCEGVVESFACVRMRVLRALRHPPVQPHKDGLA